MLRSLLSPTTLAVVASLMISAPACGKDGDATNNPDGKSKEQIDAERAKVLPTNPEYLKNMVNVDTDFWGKHKEAASERFNAWLLA